LLFSSLDAIDVPLIQLIRKREVWKVDELPPKILPVVLPRANSIQTKVWISLRDCGQLSPNRRMLFHAA